jgi:uncharacterized repeat protein (TIGR03809 family)
MSARQSPGPYDSIARKWLDLAERRKEHLIELYESGRWTHYYTEAKMVAEVRAAIRACDGWEKIVGVLSQPNAMTSERSTHDTGLGIGLPDQRYRA